ncbi:MAG: UTP--glucose-1-phosphate uridylyltransferase GalU [Eubacteriaceae bacterium]|jgi:UTP--glucose-1-phosphate uridylyltransferase
MQKVRKAVIPAAGLGTRFLPFTKSIPKEMLPIVDKPTIQYIIEEIVDSGIKDILIIIGRNKVVMVNHFDNVPELEFHLKQNGKEDELKIIEDITNMANIFTVRQKEAKGLGHAVLCAKEFVGDEPFAVVLGDDVVYNAEKPALKQMLDVYDRFGKSVIGVQRVPESETSKYGIISKQDVDGNVYKITDMVEKPPVEEAPSDLAVLGRYIITPEIFEILEHTGKGAGGEIQLTDALKELCGKDDVYACDFKGRRYDIGNKEGFLEATIEYGLRMPELKEAFREYLKQLDVDSID